MLQFHLMMPICFVIARDWKLRASVRAELRERGIRALGLETPDDAGRAMARGQMPAVLVVEACSEFASDPAFRALMSRVPAIVIASRVESAPLPRVDTVLYRPVRIAEIVARVEALLKSTSLRLT